MISAQELGVGGQAQMGIDDDGLRVVSLGEADGEAGIVGEDGADAHEDGVVGGAQRVCPLERFGGTDGERLAGLRFVPADELNAYPDRKLARGAGLALVERLPVAKRFFMRHAMGLVGDLPRLMRGEAL